MAYEPLIARLLAQWILGCDGIPLRDARFVNEKPLASHRLDAQLPQPGSRKP